jgi:polar amino acid transport system substrate-binding protein
MSFHSIIPYLFILVLHPHSLPARTAPVQQPAPLKKLVFGADEHYPPIEFRDDKGQPAGFQIELIKAIAQKLNVQVEIRMGPWSEIYAGFSKGEIDVVGMSEHDVRKKNFVFGTSLTSVVGEVFIRLGGKPVNDYVDLEGKEVIIEGGALADHVLADRMIKFTPIRVKSETDAVRLLASGKHDCAIVSQHVGRMTMKTDNLTNLTTTGAAIFNTDHALAVRKDRQHIIDKLNEGLAELKKVGEYNAIYERWLSPVERDALPLRDVWRWALRIGVPLAVIGLLALAWITLLNKQVARRNKELTDEYQKRFDLEKTLAAAQQHEALAQLAMHISHDFNNYLSIISGAAQFAQQANTLRGAHEQADLINQTANKAMLLLKALMSTARSQAMKVKRVNLNRLLHNLLPSIERLVGEQVKLHLNLGKDLPGVLTDPQCLEMVLLNLCTNARDAMHRQGHLHITASTISLPSPALPEHVTLKPGDYVHLQIQDSGIGIKQDMLQRIFDPYYSTKAVGQGTGLGLSSGLGMIQQMGGHLWAESPSESGAVFHILLPVSDEPPTEPTPTPDTKTATGATSKLPLIMVIDDEPLLAKLMQDILSKNHYSVQVAHNATEAETMLDRKPDLILCDIQLPDISGLDFSRQLESRYPRLPVIMMSGALPVQRNVYSKNVIDILQKPFQPDDLLKKINPVFRHPDTNTMIEI